MSEAVYSWTDLRLLFRWKDDARRIRGSPRTPMRPSLGSFALRPPYSVLPLRNRRTGERRDAADRPCAGRKGRRRDKKLIPLGSRRTTAHARTRKGINVGIRCCEAVREGLQEDDNQVLLVVRQAEHPRRHVEIVTHLRHRPAVHSFGFACRA